MTDDLAILARTVRGLEAQIRDLNRRMRLLESTDSAPRTIAKARDLGLTTEDYLARLRRGERLCSGCHRLLPQGAYSSRTGICWGCKQIKPRSTDTVVSVMDRDIGQFRAAGTGYVIVEPTKVRQWVPTWIDAVRVIEEAQ